MNKQTTSKQTKAVVEKISDLYIMTRKKYLEQVKIRNTKNDYTFITRHFTFHDKVVEAHLEGKRTIGVLLGNTGLTKFFSFDIDAKEESREVTFRLVECLIDVYGISPKDIHVSFSGSKGYHVDLFFDKVVHFETFEPFYLEILDRLGETKKRIERRPTNNGIKLPLGIHKKTGKRCWFVDTLTLEPIENMEHILNIQQMDFDSFKELVLDEIDSKDSKKNIKPESKPVFTLQAKQGEELESLTEKLNLEGKSVSDIEAEVMQVISAGRLINPDTRHRMTFFLPTFLYSQGWEQEEAENQILEIMLNSYDNYDDLIDKGNSSREKVISEVRRVTSLTYERGYVLNGGKKEVEVTKAEILQVLSVKKIHLKKLLLSLLIHSKRHKKKDGSFYMAYSVMTKMGNTTERGRLLKYLVELQDMGLIEIISHGEVDKARSAQAGQVVYKANEYRVLVGNVAGNTAEDNPSITIKPEDKAELIDIIPLLVKKEEAKKILPRRQWDVFKEAYKEII